MAAAADYSEDELLEYLTHLSKSRRSAVRSKQIDVALDGLLALGWGKESDGGTNSAQAQQHATSTR